MYLSASDCPRRVLKPLRCTRPDTVPPGAVEFPAFYDALLRHGTTIVTVTAGKEKIERSIDRSVRAVTVRKDQGRSWGIISLMGISGARSYCVLSQLQLCALCWLWD